MYTFGSGVHALGHIIRLNRLFLLPPGSHICGPMSTSCGLLHDDNVTLLDALQMPLLTLTHVFSALYRGYTAGLVALLQHNFDSTICMACSTAQELGCLGWRL